MINPDIHCQLIEKYIASASHCGTSLRHVGPGDAEFILSLRTDVGLSQHISSTPPSVMSQRQWIADYLERYKVGKEAYFLILHNGEPRGTIRLYNYDADADASTYGSWLIRTGTPASCAFSSTILNHDLCFRVLSFSLLRFDVRKDNKSVWKFHESVGATFVREDSTNRFYEISAELYPKVRSRLDRLAHQLYERPIP